MQQRGACKVLQQDGAAGCCWSMRTWSGQQQLMLLLRARHVQQVSLCVEGGNSRMTALRAHHVTQAGAAVLIPCYSSIVYTNLFYTNRRSTTE